jgi:hypothetical protein
MQNKITKTFLVLIAFVAMLTLTNCTYNEAPYESSGSNLYTYTEFKTIYRSEWTQVEAGHWYKRLSLSYINKSVIDYGAVFVYYRNADNNWVMLPYSTTLYNTNGLQFSEEIWSGYALGTLDIDYVYTDPLDMTPPTTLELKIVVMRL